ncbi:MAG: hypothetical protein Unbinned6437contig1000_8 [Prokaryotic dsDNA virus sp.]|nr:MAG: hypothetical protein Unbinned6437contig1000_8 [Prokaryotic dsDNA virus sp.]|tara:strand:+ start:40640 stop:40759 length:120 start_codon:yes stop_codon:yes gene_type:complete
MTPVEMFLTVLYAGTCFLLYGVITLISKFEDEYLTGEKK